MSTIQDFDITKERIQLQDMMEEIRNLLNNGNLEIEVTTASSPAFEAPQETKLVFSVFGAQFRMYISYLGEWYFTTFAKL